MNFPKSTSFDPDPRGRLDADLAAFAKNIKGKKKTASCETVFRG